MAVFPLVMNVIQFCLVDQVIKSSKEPETEEDEEEGGYRRIPTREADMDVTPRNLSVGGAKRRGSAPKSRSISPAGPATPLTPKSPLLSPANHGDGRRGVTGHHYGGDSPSPGLDVEHRIAEAFWANFAKRSPSDAESNSCARSAHSSKTGGEDRLRVRHGGRSGAPSPDSLRPIDVDSIHLDMTEGLLPLASDPPLTALSGISRLSDDMRLEARRSLSPVTRQTVPKHLDEDEELGLQEFE